MQYKRILMSCLIVILILCTSVLSIGATEETPFEVAVEVTSSTAVSKEPLVLQAGDSFTVSISIDGNPTFSLIELKLNYDAEALTLVTKADGTVDFVGGELFTNDELYVDATKSGTIKVLNTNDSKAIKGNGTIITFNFKVNENVHADVAVELAEAIFVNAAYDIFQPAIIANTKEVHVHKITAEPVVEAATCKAPAKSTYTCDTCKESFVVLGTELGEHTFGEWTTITPATCTAKGTEERVCTVCTEAKETKELDALGHDYSTEWTVDKEANCVAPGSKSHHCSRCDSTTDVTEVPALGHDFGDWTVETAATCTASGVEKRSCNRAACYESETRAIAATGHKSVPFDEVPATKDAPGFTGGTRCSECNITLTERALIPQLKDYTWIYILVAVVVVVAIAGGVCAYVFVVKKKKANG